MAIEYNTITYRTCEGLDNLRFSWCELSKSHVPKQVGIIKQIIIPNRLSNETYLCKEPRYLGVWERSTSGDLVRIGVSRNVVAQKLGITSVWDFDGLPNSGNGLVLALLADPNGDWDDINLDEHIGGRGNANDTDGCVLYSTISGSNKHSIDIIFTIQYEIEVPDPEPDQDPEDDPTQDPEDDPEDEQKLREIDIRNYWRPAVRDTLEFQEIAKAINPELMAMQARIYEIVNENFIATASDYGLSRYEKMLNISPEEGDTLDDRRVRILTRMNMNVPYTWRSVNQMLTNLVGEGNHSMNYVNDTSTLTVTVKSEYKDKVSSFLTNVLPMNIVVIIEEGV